MYEVRIYRAKEGKFDKICDRFADGTLAIFERLNIEVTDFWIDNDKGVLAYVCKFESVADQTEKWSLFSSDPEWKALSVKSEENGPLLESIESFNMERAPFFKSK
ncbi:MAG: NIPSNAP family protein [Ruminococcaceae bacterium]|nr:NIPSNAP family protein [Oscillospiraceae bacterium]